MTIVYRDQHLLVLNKPVGIATTSPEGDSLFERARALDPEAPALHPLSRLDTQVSGLTTFARTELANRVANVARRDGKLRRSYLGIAARQPDEQEGDWRFPIAFDVRDPKKRQVAEISSSKAAHTHWRVVATAGSLVAFDFWPITGRTHQLRVHASHAGYPLLGDMAYGGEKRLTLANGRILSAQRVMLHCAAFRMPDPAKRGSVITLSLEPPDDMQKLWRGAGGDPAVLKLSLT
ncbi:MAG TPA: RluA family pseudouridine synthase [Polyangiales bacterium]|nr:RluA family pseudouridine synthase [Polyangiales bacterium]